MSKFRRLAFVTIGPLLGLSCISAVAGQECKPRDFTFQDIERTDISDSIRLAASSYFKSDSSGANQKSFGASLPIEGIPVSLSANDYSQFAQHVLRESNYNFSQDMTASFLRTQLSVVGADMYANCLGTQNIAVSAPETAFSQNSFFLNVRWKPQYAKAPDEADYAVKVINGKADGNTVAKGKIGKFEDVSIAIEKSADKVTEVGVSIDGRTYPSLAFPPVIRFPPYKMVQRRGVSQQGRDRGGNRCTDTAYLVSEVGSSAGNGAKSCKLCVSASDGGFLFRDTARVSASLSSRGAGAKVLDDENTALEACGYFWTDGAGQGSGRFEVGEGAYFTVWEAVPRN